MQNRKAMNTPLSHQEGIAERDLVVRELSFRLAESLAAIRRRMLQFRDMLNADHLEPRSTLVTTDHILAEIDGAYVMMMKLRGAMRRRTAPGSIPQRKGDGMNQSEPLVIVVDDSPSVRRALSRLLHSVGLQVQAYSSARQFLDLDLPDTPCCAVLDVRMPRMSGLDLQKEMAQRGIDIPVVFITGHGDIDMAVQAMKDGAVDFLPKPFNEQDLLDAIDRALDRHHALRDEQARIAEVQARADRLTPRERQVMGLVITGMLNKQIAGELGTAEKTIKVHRARVMEKMEADSVAELVRLAARIGVEGPGRPDDL